jgi:Fe-S oxidoreductase
VKIIDVMRALRNTLVELDISYAPEPLRITMVNLSSVGNPLGEAPEKRADWAKELGIKTFNEDTDLLYFPCCIPCYDPKATGIARATASILKKLGVNFGILGVNESCCGEAIRKAGAESVFQDLAQNNIATFAENGVKEVAVSSPHCYNTFKNEYPELGGNFEVVHFTQYLSQAIKEKELKFTKEVKKRVTYHDPCYLGRHNGIYDEPREVLKSIPGLELVEMPNSRENSLCCGGGGGRIWMETRKEERLADLRLKQALDVGAEILATACPYCLINLKDSVVSMDKEKVIEVKDVSEIVQEAI